MESANPDMGERALSKAAEIGISSQLDEAENVDVDLRTDPGKLFQGKLDSVAISGQGLVMKEDLRMESLEVSMGEVAINPLTAVLGKIELTHPTDAEAEIVLTEVDLNRALMSSYIQEKLQNLELVLDGQTERVDVRQVRLTLPGENKLAVDADFSIEGQGESKTLSAVAIPRVRENGSQILLEILSTEGQGLDHKLVSVIFEQLAALLDLRNFDIPNMSLQLNQLEAQKGRLLIHAKTQIEQFPSA
jgi:LmeA-like phospholipid-binding